MLEKMRPVAALIAILSLLGCAGTQPKPVWVAAPDADIEGRTTFGWENATGSRPLPVFETQVRKAVRAELEKRGYVESTDSGPDARPDFLIGYEAVEFESTTRSPPVSVGIGMGTRGGNVGGSVGTSVGLGGKSSQNHQQRITIRALEGDRAAELWVGTTGVLPEHPDGAAIDRAVAGVMRGFPSRRK
jgi:hypothetical protein